VNKNICRYLNGDIHMNMKQIVIGVITITFLSSLFFVGSSVAVAEDTVFYVGGSGMGNYSSIQDALDLASDGDTVFVYPGVYNENIFINTSLHLIGDDAETTIVDGQGLGNVLSVYASSVSIDSLTVQHSLIPVFEKENGTTPSDNSTSDSSKPGFQKDVINDTYYDELYNGINYSGMFITADLVEIRSCIIRDCHIGVVFNNVSNDVIADSSFFDNSNGINMYNSNNCNIINSTLSENEQGCSLLQTSISIFTGCSITNNNASGFSLTNSNRNIVYNNVFSGNYFGVVVSTQSEDNIFYKNNFYNAVGMHSIDNALNLWDYNGLGNYWDDYQGTDEDSDGIGDQSYVFTLIGEDHFPLMEPVVMDAFDTMSISMLTPMDGAEVTGLMNISGVIESSVGIDTVQVQIDDGDLLVATGTDNFTLQYDTSMLSSGSHSLYVYGMNVQGDIVVSQVDFIVEEDGSGSEGDAGDGSPTPGIGAIVGIMVVVLFMVVVSIKKKR